LACASQRKALESQLLNLKAAVVTDGGRRHIEQADNRFV